MLTTAACRSPRCGGAAGGGHAARRHAGKADRSGHARRFCPQGVYPKIINPES